MPPVIKLTVIFINSVLPLLLLELIHVVRAIGAVKSRERAAEVYTGGDSSVADTTVTSGTRM